MLATALIVAIGAIGAAGASAASVQPDAAQMVLTTDDFSHAVQSSQGRKGPIVIASASAYTRAFTGVQVGKTHLTDVVSTVMVGKSPESAANLVTVVKSAIKTHAGRAALLAETSKSFAAGAHLKVKSARIVRSGPIAAGDAGVEVVFAFSLPGETFVLGEEFVAVSQVLSTVEYGGGASLSGSAAHTLAKVMAAHITSVLYPLPANTVLPTVTGTPDDHADADSCARHLDRQPHLHLPVGALQHDRRGCVAIAGSTTSTYVVSTADVNSTLAVSVTGKNVTGSATAQSAATAIVAWL